MMKIVKQNISSDCKTYECKAYDPIKDFVMDPSGNYVLIRVDKVESVIELAVCNKDHSIIAVFKGKSAQSIYQSLFDVEQQEEKGWFKSNSHIAYVGKELNRAESSLDGNKDYIQE